MLPHNLCLRGAPFFPSQGWREQRGGRLDRQFPGFPFTAGEERKLSLLCAVHSALGEGEEAKGVQGLPVRDAEDQCQKPQDGQQEHHSPLQDVWRERRLSMRGSLLQRNSRHSTFNENSQKKIAKKNGISSPKQVTSGKKAASGILGQSPIRIQTFI